MFYTRRVSLVLTLFSLIALVFVGFTPAVPSHAQGGLKFGAIIKTEANEYWQAMKKGYEFAAARYGVTIDVGSVPSEADTAQQLALVESWLGRGYNALLVSPITPLNLNSALAAATRSGIPVINVDEIIPDDAAKEAGIAVALRIASNNYQAGQLAGNWVLDNTPAGGKVAILEGLAGNVSGQNRRDGFADTVKDKMNLVASQPADWDRAKALNVATNILQANPDLVAIYACNDTMALGAVEAVAAANLSGKVAVIGTDAVPEALEAVKAGRMAGTVAQFPFEIGVLAVENAIKLAEGRPIPSKIDAPIKLITAANIDKPVQPIPDPKIPAFKFGAMIKTEANEFWGLMKRGYEFAAKTYGVTVDVGSVASETDTAAQLALLESWLGKGYNALLISPLTPDSLNTGLAKATKAGLPILNIDELIPADAAKAAGIDISFRIASNNVQAGRLAGNWVIDNIKAGSKVAILEGKSGNVSGIDRRDGEGQDEPCRQPTRRLGSAYGQNCYGRLAKSQPRFGRDLCLQ